MRRSFGSRIRDSPERAKSCDRAIEKQCQPAGVKPEAPILPDLLHRARLGLDRAHPVHCNSFVIERIVLLAKTRAHHDRAAGF